MKKIILIALLGVLAACIDQTGRVVDMSTKSKQVQNGMNKSQVAAILGEPGFRTFRGTREAMQYCEVTPGGDRTLTVWLDKTVVVGTTAETHVSITAFCPAGFADVDWSKFPSEVTPAAPEDAAKLATPTLQDPLTPVALQPKPNAATAKEPN